MAAGARPNRGPIVHTNNTGVGDQPATMTSRNLTSIKVSIFLSLPEPELAKQNPSLTLFFPLLFFFLYSIRRESKG